MTRLEMPVLRMRSKLFVPASRPELFDKAMRSEADALSFDLEDAVEESRKGEARQLLADFFASLPPENTRQMLVRVNGVRTAHFDDGGGRTRPGGQCPDAGKRRRCGSCGADAGAA